MKSLTPFLMSECCQLSSSPLLFLCPCSGEAMVLGDVQQHELGPLLECTVQPWQSHGPVLRWSPRVGYSSVFHDLNSLVILEHGAPYFHLHMLLKIVQVVSSPISEGAVIISDPSLAFQVVNKSITF